MSTRLPGLLAVLLLCAAVPALATCMDGRAPTPAQEAATATGVVRVRVLSAEPLHEDASDPGGVSATRYRVQRLRLIHGQLPATFDLYSDNTSARFPMTVGERYLLYVQRDRDGRHYVDACGHSRLLPARS